MLLAIDVGNTETVVGVFRDEELVWRWRMATVPDRTADELALLFGGFLQQQELSFDRNVTGVVLSSVVPNATQALREMVRRYFRFQPVVVEPGVKTGVPVLTDNPKEVGADRIVNALAAFTAYGGPCVVVDFGTATTFDVIDEGGRYCGGVIATGINLSLEALHRAAAKLPRVAVERPDRVIGTSTVSAMQSGVFWGYVSMIEGIVARIRSEFGAEMKVIATGGLAGLFAGATDVIEHVDRDLTMAGLVELYYADRPRKSN